MPEDNKFILLVDDEPDICHELELFLTRKGYGVLTAPDGKEALKLFKKTMPVLVITDYKMPVMDGIELLKAVKSIKQETQVIFISGHADMKVVVKAIKEDAFDFLSKPIDLKELLETIKIAFERFQKTKVEKKLDKFKEVSSETVYHNELAISIINFNVSLDEYTKTLIEEEVKKMVMKKWLHERVIFVFKDVKYINNMGLNAIMDLAQILKGNNMKLMISQLSQPVYKYLETLGYLDYLDWEDNLETALTKISQGDLI